MVILREKSLEGVLDLVPLCQTQLQKQQRLCKLCKDGTQGIFTHQNIQKKQNRKVIGANNYIPLCRKCYQKRNFKLK